MLSGSGWLTRGYAQVRRPCHAALIALSLLGSGCGRWHAGQPHVVSSQVAPDIAYRQLLVVLEGEKYQLIERSDPQRAVRVRSHVNEDEANEASFIGAEVDPSGAIRFTPSGYLVRPDGKVHARLTREIEGLRERVEKLLSAGGAPPEPSASAALTGGLPRGFYQPAPAGQGEGELTCLPLHIADDTELRLRLSNGEVADVLVALDNSAGICTSECRAPGGCPALGVGDRDKVDRLAARLAAAEVDWEAQIVANGSPIVVVDLSRHRFIKQALSRARGAGGTK